MTLVQQPHDELRQLLHSLADSSASAAGIERIDRLVGGDVRLMREYIEYMRLIADLRFGETNRQIEDTLTRLFDARAFGDQSVESRESRVESGATVANAEWRVASEAEYPEIPKSLNPQIPEVPVIDLQIPTRHSPLATLHSWAVAYSVATLFLAVALLGAWFTTFTHPAANSLAIKNSRRSTTSRGTAKDPEQFIFVGRIGGMVDCQWADDATATYPGAGVTLGRRYALKSGLMEITYDNGAKVILQGPCEYKVESPRGGFLQVGKLVARVSKKREGGREKGEESNSRRLTASSNSAVEEMTPEAVSLRLLSNSENPKSQIPNPKSLSPLSPLPSPLFAVRTPTALVEDLGTEFGVEVLQSGETASHVFQGQVVMRTEGSGVGGQGSGTENPKSNIPNPKSEILLSAGESARVAPDSGAIRSTPDAKGDTAGFVRSIPRRMRIETFNTGVGVKEGQSDPHWQLIARGDQPGFKPHPAFVLHLSDRSPNIGPWLENTVRSRWISAVDKFTAVPDGLYTFRTTFDLGDARPDTAVLQGKFIADNSVKAIRLNGVALAVPDHPTYYQPFRHFYTFYVRQGFSRGINVLEFDVVNGGPGLEPGSALGLRVELDASAVVGGAEQTTNQATKKP